MCDKFDAVVTRVSAIVEGSGIRGVALMVAEVSEEECTRGECRYHFEEEVPYSCPDAERRGCICSKPIDE